MAIFCYPGRSRLHTQIDSPLFQTTNSVAFISGYRWRLWIRRKKERHNAPDNKYYSIDSTHPADENADPENSSLSTYSDPERNDSYSLADSNQVSQWFKDCVYEQLAASRTRGRPGEVDWFYQDISRKYVEYSVCSVQPRNLICDVNCNHWAVGLKTLVWFPWYGCTHG